ncbi:Transcription factor [Aspergillus melleus]|uniref:Transcription factor n=1 Tax=Aspergillus melleus TaxID=138277 RepID=UPI001E8D2449|nr:Transcription factor [Aspergillus melleus]KAH8424826.1 Transcription factor [Aspergillus melleus]
MSPASEHESETGRDQFSDLETESEPDQTPTHLTLEQLELWFELTEWIINAEGPPYYEKLEIAPEMNGRYDAIESRFFTWGEYKELAIMFNCGIYKFSAPYAKAYKYCSGYFLRDNKRFPCIAFESGHESWSNLLKVKDMWLQGGTPYVNAVVLIKWDERDNGDVAGSLELHRRGGIACPQIDVFPVPSPGTLHAAQTVTFCRRDLYPAGKVPEGRDPNDVWNWEIDKLREEATWTMGLIDLRPAEA